MSLFSTAERQVAAALAAAALPAGRLLAGAGEATLDRLEGQLAQMPSAVQAAYKGGLWSLEWGTLASSGTRFSALPLGRRLVALERIEKVEATRLALRGLLSLMKLAWLDDPQLFEKLGCRFAIEPPGREEAARWRNQVVDGATLAGGEAVECDVVVVGTGAGGAPLAMSLAERGLAVLLLEEGPLFTRRDFNGRPMEMIRKMYKKAGLTASVGNHVIPIPLGRGVGGTTLINSGTCFRAPDKTLANWRDEAGLSWFTPEALAPYYEQVERFLEVAPSSPQALGAPATLVARGCDALGYAHHALARNAPGCDGQGMCCFGCPTDAKRSTNVSYVPAALNKGAQLATGVRVDKVLVKNGRAVGVEADAGGQRLTVRARAVVLACGALATPVLLQRQGLANASGEVGKNLSIHPAAGAIAVFNERVDGWNTVPQGYAIDEFKDEGLYFEGASAPLELAALSHTGFGPSWVALMEEFPRSLMFGFMVKDTSRGAVRPRGDDALITYWLNQHDVHQVRRGLGILSRVYFAAGAREVHLPVPGARALKSLDDVARFEKAPLAAREVDLTAYHPLGTCRMGTDPKHSVVGVTHETHDLPGLYLCDGSVMPSSLGVNPQLTIMAMALRAAEQLGQSL